MEDTGLLQFIILLSSLMSVRKVAAFGVPSFGWGLLPLVSESEEEKGKEEEAV